MLGHVVSESVKILRSPQHPLGDPPQIPPLPCGGMAGFPEVELENPVLLRRSVVTVLEFEVLRERDVASAVETFREVGGVCGIDDVCKVACELEIACELEAVCERREIIREEWSPMDVINCAKVEGPAKTSNTLNSFMRKEW